MKRGNQIEIKGLTDTQIRFIENIETYYQEGDYEKLYKTLRGATIAWSKWFVRRWGNSYKLEIDDVISECNVRLVQLINDELEMDNDNSFYSNYKKHIQGGVFKNILRDCQTNKKLLSMTHYYNVGTKDNPDFIIVESIDYLKDNGIEIEDRQATASIDNVLNKMQLEAMYKRLGTGFYTEHEEAILTIMRVNPEINIKQLQTTLGINYYETMRRILKKLRTKLKSQGLDWDSL